MALELRILGDLAILLRQSTVAGLVAVAVAPEQVQVAAEAEMEQSV